MQNRAVSQSGGKSFTLVVSGSDAVSLRPGEIVTAEVLGLEGDHSVSIRLNDTVLSVRTDVPVQKGDVLSLRVEKQENFDYLRLAGSEAESADAARSDVPPAQGQPGNFMAGAETLVRLLDLLQGVPEELRGNMPEIAVMERFLLPLEQLSGKTLKDAVENGGVFFETKLRILAHGLEIDGPSADLEAKHIIANDLKAALLRLKDTLLRPGFLDLVANSGVDAKAVLDTLNGALKHIEFYQLQSKLTDSLQFYLPLVWKELKDGELILRESDRGQQNERSYSCSIHLDLEGAGRVRVNLLLQAGSVHVSCAAENNGLYGLLRNSSGMLEAQFKASGLRLGSLTIRHEDNVDFDTHRAAGLSIRA